MNTILTTAFTSAFCDREGPLVACACGHTWAAEDGKPVKYGDFSGSCIVEGCGCGPSEAIANTFWAARHKAAKFYRRFIEAMRKDEMRLVSELPETLGQEEA